MMTLEKRSFWVDFLPYSALHKSITGIYRTYFVVEKYKSNHMKSTHMCGTAGCAAKKHMARVMLGCMLTLTMVCDVTALRN